MQDSQELVREATTGRFDSTQAVARIQGELVRKSIHLLVAFVPTLASVNLSGTLVLLAVGTLFYAFSEASRLSGVTIPLVTDITLLASRERDRRGFVLGPVTLAIGTMLALLLYPLPAATLAIYALAFGDGFASLVGTLLRGPKLPLLRSKTVSGSLACFVAVFLIALRVTGRMTSALVVAATATILEAIPFGNFDNVVIPVGVGLVAVRLALF